MYLSLKDRYKPERLWPGGRQEPFPIEGGHVVLQFVNTCIDKDYIENYNDFLKWCTEFKIVDEDEYDEYELNAYCYAAEAKLVCQRATNLRWTVYELVKCALCHKPVHERDILLLNEYVKEANAHLRYELVKGNLRRVWFDNFEDVAEPLWILTKHVELMLQMVDFKNIKRCTCGKFYLDTTKNKNRRWCNPLVCGNAARAKKYKLERAEARARRLEDSV